MSQYLLSIYKWYDENKRDLPWRQTSDPYKIWVSEIILQQTRIEQGLNYYLRFIDKFPTILKLAEASEDEVLKMWQGLGYYSRARNLHQGANQIINNHKGKFPNNYSDIISLKGIGKYTAAAVGSIAFNLPYPAVDGNVYRLLSRYFGISDPIDSSKGKKIFYELAESIININDPGMHNQAFMEFGAKQCIPRNPVCNTCPINNGCQAYNRKTVNQLPVKLKKLKQTNRYFTYLALSHPPFIYLQKRTQKDIWTNLYEFPLIESIKKEKIEDILVSDDFSKIIGNSEINIESTTNWGLHILSHQKINYRFINITVKKPYFQSHLLKIEHTDLDKYAVPRLIEKYLEEI